MNPLLTPRPPLVPRPSDVDLFSYVAPRYRQEIGMTPVIRNFFRKLDALLPESFLSALDNEADAVFVVDMDAQGQPAKLAAYRSFPAEGQFDQVNVAQDWGRHQRVWFRQRPLYNPTSVMDMKYECLVSYAEDYRPVFEVDLKAPIFVLTINAFGVSKLS